MLICYLKNCVQANFDTFCFSSQEYLWRVVGIQCPKPGFLLGGNSPHSLHHLPPHMPRMPHFPTQVADPHTTAQATVACYLQMVMEGEFRDVFPWGKNSTTKHIISYFSHLSRLCFFTATSSECPGTLFSVLLKDTSIRHRPSAKKNTTRFWDLHSRKRHAQVHNPWLC